MCGPPRAPGSAHSDKNRGHEGKVQNRVGQGSRSKVRGPRSYCASDTDFLPTSRASGRTTVPGRSRGRHRRVGLQCMCRLEAGPQTPGVARPAQAPSARTASGGATHSSKPVGGPAGPSCACAHPCSPAPSSVRPALLWNSLETQGGAEARWPLKEGTGRASDSGSRRRGTARPRLPTRGRPLGH